MAKRTIDAKQVLTDIKSGMDDSSLMQKYQLSKKGIQSLFKKLVDGGVLNPGDLEKRGSPPEKSLEIAWKCPICGNPQTTQYDKCPECSAIAARFKDRMATTQQLAAKEPEPSPFPEEASAPLGLSHIVPKGNLDKLAEALRNPYGLAIAAIAALTGFVLGAVFASSIGGWK
jgi:hypothetical protein